MIFIAYLFFATTLSFAEIGINSMGVYSIVKEIFVIEDSLVAFLLSEDFVVSKSVSFWLASVLFFNG